MNICLQDFIGLRGCSTVEPESGVYINQYPGMSTELLDKVASSDQVTFAQVWQDIQATAYLMLRTSIQSALKKWANTRMDQVIFQTARPFVQQWQQIEGIPSSPIYRGVFSSIAGSKFSAMRVKSIYIYNSGDVAVENVPIKFFQCQDGTILFETTKTIEPGFNTIPINQVFTLEFDKINIALLVDCTNLPVLSGQFLDYGYFGWQAMDAQCASRYSSWVNAVGFNVFPITAPLDYGLGQSWNTDFTQSGIYWDAQLICSLDSFICSQKEFLTESWGNLLCAQTLRTKLASNRVNWFTQSQRDTTERNMTTFMGEFNDALNGWAQQINIGSEGLCFSCNGEEMVRTIGRKP